MARPIADIEADIADARAARAALVKGERVTEVWRDGRRLTFAGITMPQVNDLLDTLNRELGAAQAEAEGRPRRRAIGLSWKN